MKIVDFRTFVVGNPPPHFGGRYFLFVKLTTDSGVTGIGEVYVATFGPHVVARMIETSASASSSARTPSTSSGCGDASTAAATACARTSRWWAC